MLSETPENEPIYDIDALRADLRQRIMAVTALTPSSEKLKMIEEIRMITQHAVERITKAMTEKRTRPNKDIEILNDVKELNSLLLPHLGRQKDIFKTYMDMSQNQLQKITKISPASKKLVERLSAKLTLDGYVKQSPLDRKI